ncbi:Gti1/Pac2 family-domain-containing protein, partial [Morchella snyderi]
MSSHANQPVCPTVTGVTIESTADALKIVKACQKQYFHCVPRRPLDNERSDLIKSGNVFVYEENESRIKRWTDSIRWSPSRAMTNLLVYREVFDKFKPGGRRPYTSGRSSSRGHDQGDGHMESSPSPQEMGQDLPMLDPLLQALRPEERKAVVGSLHDSYLFKEDGLCKKTLAVTIDQYKYHIVAYFKISDVLNKSLRRPEEIYPFLREIDVRSVAEMNPRYKHHIDVSGRY